MMSTGSKLRTEPNEFNDDHRGKCTFPQTIDRQPAIIRPTTWSVRAPGPGCMGESMSYIVGTVSKVSAATAKLNTENVSGVSTGHTCTSSMNSVPVRMLTMYCALTPMTMAENPLTAARRKIRPIKLKHRDSWKTYRELRRGIRGANCSVECLLEGLT